MNDTKLAAHECSAAAILARREGYYDLAQYLEELARAAELGNGAQLLVIDTMGAREGY
jgi:hypothetical protein